MRVQPRTTACCSFWRLTKGNLIFLQDQYLYELEEEQRFPTREIIITRSIHSDGILRVEPEGEYLRPSRERPPLTILPHRPGLPFRASLVNV